MMGWHKPLCSANRKQPYQIFFEESLFNTTAQRQKYNISDSTEPIWERHLHLTCIQKNTLLIVFMDKVHLDKTGYP